MSLRKPIPLKPWTGPLDVRTPPDLLAFGSWRRRLNFWTPDTNKLRRARGYRRLLYGEYGYDCQGGADADYNDQDLHDQLLPLCQAGSVREPITLIYEAVSTSGSRYLIVGTKSRIYQLNESTGAWRVLADGMGVTDAFGLDVRWQCAQVLDTIVFTNGVDKPMSYTLDDPIDPATGIALKPIPDLDAIDLEKAQTICAFKDIIILGGITIGGAYTQNAIVWSGRFAPTQFDPAQIDSTTGASLADEQMLNSYERVIRLITFGEALVVYTNQRIWRGTATGNADQPIEFAIVYESTKGDRCLAYPNTLVSTGEELVWASRDGIYSLNPFYDMIPRREEWMHLASKMIFDSIDTEQCEPHVAGYHPETKEIYLSWTEIGHSQPSRTLVFDMVHRNVYERDFAASCYGIFRRDPRSTFRDWLLGNCICSTNDLKESMQKEALFRCGGCTDNPPSVFLTADTVTIDGLETEDWTQVEPDIGSAASRMNLRTDDLCGSCNEKQLFIFAHAEDWCLKQIDDVYAYDSCTNFLTERTADDLDGDGNYTAFVGHFESRGYYSIMASGPISFADTQTILHGFILDQLPEAQIDPCVVSLRVGQSYSPVDPAMQIGGHGVPVNPLEADACAVVWQREQRKYLKCPQLMRGAEYMARNLSPNISATQWELYASGRYLYFELVIGRLSNQSDLKSNLLPALGGSCMVSGATLLARRQ
jgi:hypothetical protein